VIYDLENRLARRWLGVVILALMLASAGCDRRGDERSPPTAQQVVVYTSVDRLFSEPVLKEAEKRLGLKVIGVYDTEETKSTGLVNRLIARKDNPDGDIFWSGDPLRAALLKAKGVTAAYDPPAAASIPALYKDPEHHWIGFSARSRVLLVNTNLVPAGDEPRRLADLADAKWKGKVAIANPLFGTTSFHVAAIFEAQGDEKAREWLDALKANGVQIVSSNGEVKRQVASGGAAVGLADSDDAAEAIKDGQPVRTVFLDQADQTGGVLGSLVIPNTVSLIHGGPNPNGARSVVGFLLSAEAQRLLAESCAQAPLTPGIVVPPGILGIDKIVPMRVNYATAAATLERILPWLKEWVEQK
jgi:iron(III) transport system substrate-binding protein